MRTGIIFLVVLIVGVYFGFTKHIPFKHGYRLNAVFSSSVNVRPKSPVRIAGVTVGTVTSTRLESSHAALVTMEIEGKGLPIHSDATLKIRPKIFLEGNWFVELQPGSPSAPDLSSGATIPVTQTSEPVQLDQLLDALNTDTRANLQTFLVEYGAALTAKPTPAENAEQSPEVRGLNLAQALNKAYRLRAGSAARRHDRQPGVRRHRNPRPLQAVCAASKKSAPNSTCTSRRSANWSATSTPSCTSSPRRGRACARRSPNCRARCAALEHGFVELRGAAPSIRTFALDLIPGVEQIPATDAAAFPWIEQLRATLKPNELGGVAAALRTAAPEIASRHRRAGRLPAAAHQLQQVPEQGALPGRLHQAPGWRQHLRSPPPNDEFWYAMAGVAGLSQNFDGNGAAPRFIAGGAGTTLLSPPATVVKPGAPTDGSTLIAQTRLAPEGTSPRFTGNEPPYKPLVPCYTQKLPEFNGPLSHGPADGGGG